VIVALVALCGATVTITACNDTGPRIGQRPAPEDAVSEALMISLAQAKNFHHLADVHESNDEIDEAIAAVSRILTIDFPRGAPEAEDTILDAHARLAMLHLGAGRIDEAEKIARAGLGEATRDSFFVANLYTVLGQVHKARAATLGDAEAVRAERHRAIEALHRSIEINQAIQKQLEEQRASEEAKP
jgi:tetratricopeptide (TPR) repeat protein